MPPGPRFECYASEADRMQVAKYGSKKESPASVLRLVHSLTEDNALSCSPAVHGDVSRNILARLNIAER